MNESQAWRIVAEEYDAGRNRSEFLCLNIEFASSGSYYNAAIATISHQLRWKMGCRIEDALPEGTSTAYRGDRGDAEHEGRLMACLLFSEMAKDRASR